MKILSNDRVKAVLTGLGLKAGDGVIVHSALHFLGKAQNGVDTFLQPLCEVLNILLPSREINADANRGQGTLVVPTYNFGFARGIPFDILHSPAEGMGVLSESVRTLPEARRTPHPLQSIAAIGAHSDDLARRDTTGAFDDHSAFDRMVELDFYILLLGADIQAVSLLHFSEQRVGVPYRYWKEFSGEVQNGNRKTSRTARMYARNLDLDPRLEIYAIQRLLEQRNQWRSEVLNYGKVSLFRARHFINAATELLTSDPWTFVTNRPE